MKLQNYSLTKDGKFQPVISLPSAHLASSFAQAYLLPFSVKKEKEREKEEEETTSL